MVIMLMENTNDLGHHCVSKNTFIYCWPEEPLDFSQWQLLGKFIL